MREYRDGRSAARCRVKRTRPTPARVKKEVKMAKKVEAAVSAKEV